jgi:hypothetical protein
MLDINDARAGFAARIALNPDMNAALIGLINDAYQKGQQDAMQVPPVLRDTVPNLVTRMETGNGSAAGADLAAMAAPGLPQTAGSAGQGSSTESRDHPPAQQPPDPQPAKGGALAKLAGMWSNDASFHSWLKKHYPNAWTRHAAPPETDADTPQLTAINIIREFCNIKSRAELDHNPTASAAFHKLIRAPYAEHLKAK